MGLQGTASRAALDLLFPGVGISLLREKIPPEVTTRENPPPRMKIDISPAVNFG